jgi:hypothetical protein
VLPATCYLLHATYHENSYEPPATCYLLPTKSYTLPPAVRTRMRYLLLSTECHLLLSTRTRFAGTCYILPATCYLLSATC